MEPDAGAAAGALLAAGAAFAAGTELAGAAIEFEGAAFGAAPAAGAAMEFPAGADAGAAAEESDFLLLLDLEDLVPVAAPAELAVEDPAAGLAVESVLFLLLDFFVEVVLAAAPDCVELAALALSDVGVDFLDFFDFLVDDVDA